MTVSNTDSPVKIYTGTATEYPIPFDYISDDDILVTLYNTTTGAATDQTIDVDYTIVEETVTYSEEPGAEYNVVIRRVTEFTQEASFGPGEEPPLSTHESAFDKLTMLAQDLNERLERCIMFPDSYSGTDFDFELPNPTGNAGRLLRINEDGTGLDVLAVSDSGQATEVTDYCDTADLEKLHDITVEAAVINADKPVNKGADITVTVGSGGDYSTINDALAALSAYYPLYVSGGFTAEISLLTGFTMAEQVLVSGIDLSWITITAVDASTTITRSALTVSFGGTYPAFGVIMGRLPVIGALFSMDSSGTATNRNFITARDGSFVKVSVSCGCQYAGENGIALYDASSAMLTGADFSHATNNGIYAKACVVQANGANVSYAGSSGVLSAYASSVDASSANGENASTSGFRVATGGNICAGGVTGTLSQAENTLTASGIIYRFT